MPAGSFTAHWFCLGEFIGREKQLGSEVFTYRAGETLELTLTGDSSGCDQQPVRERRGRLIGHYEHGFEESRFMPVDDPTVTAWARWGWWGMSTDLRDEVFAGLETGCAYVELLGVLRGPSYYGHMLGSEYEVIVEEVFVARPADPDRCAAARDSIRLGRPDFR